MPLSPPDLDDRTFEALVTEIRKRIPSFTPEWTDLNESDPGITLAQLFAFMTEHLLFQINQVPDKGLVAFLRMVGAELHPAVPATADVTLSGMVSGAPDAYVLVERGTVITTAGPPPGEKSAVRFETTKDLAYLRGTLEDVVTIDCDRNVTSHAMANASGTGTVRPFGRGRSVEDVFYLALALESGTGPWPAGTFTLRVNIAGSPEVGEPPIRDEADPAERRIQWSYASANTDGPSGPELQFTDFTPALDSTSELTRSGYLEIRFDAPGAMVQAPAGTQPSNFEHRFVIRARMVAPDVYGATPPELATLRLNTVPARNLTTVVAESLGGSTALPFQRLRLANAPVFPGSVLIEITPPGGSAEQWTEVDDLFTAGPRDRVFQLLPATGEILFGNGSFGRIPPPDTGAVSGGNIVAARYQWGGGRRGNVGAGTLTRVQSPVGITGVDAVNELAARAGDDEEPVDEGVTRAPAVVRSRYRAVAAADFEALSRETPDARIARSLALTNTRAGLRPGMTPGAVTVVLVPNAPFEETRRTPIPLPAATAASVLRYLDARRLVTTQVFVTGATFRQVVADVSLVVARGASQTATRTAALEALFRYFHPIEGGDEGKGWPFGGPIFFSRVFERLLRVRGVARVDRLRLSIDGSDLVECDDLPIHDGELLYSGEHVVRVEALR